MTMSQGEGKDHPRSRGEYAFWAVRHAVSAGSSPLSRGIPPGRDLLDQAFRIIPALAGNTAAYLRLPQTTGDHPRSRGEYRHPGMEDAAQGGSSPLSRGILGDEAAGGGGEGIIPALAGNTDWPPYTTRNR